MSSQTSPNNQENEEYNEKNIYQSFVVQFCECLSYISTKHTNVTWICGLYVLKSTIGKFDISYTSFILFLKVLIEIYVLVLFSEP